MQASHGRIGVRHEVARMAQTLRGYGAPSAVSERLTRPAVRNDSVATHIDRASFAVLAGSAAGVCRRRSARPFPAMFELTTESMKLSFQQWVKILMVTLP
eukprot:symbB.v1.2.039769.t1/scaffold6772.1/size15637/2